MKAVIPINEKSQKSKVSTSFGRAAYFFLYDTESGQEHFVENTAANSSGGAGIQAAQQVVDLDAACVVVPQCGKNAAKVLQAAGVTLYKTNSSSLAKTIEDLKEERLAILWRPHDGYHGEFSGGI